jgi:hypothetical protein
MQVLNNHRIKINCRIEYIIQYAKDYNPNSDLKVVNSSLDKIKTIYDDVNTFETNIIPDLKDRVRADLLPKRYKSMQMFLENGVPVLLFSGDNMIIDTTGASPILYMNKTIRVNIYEKSLKEYASTNINKPEWESGVPVDEIRKLSLDDIFNLYHQTMHTGVKIIID